MDSFQKKKFLTYKTLFQYLIIPLITIGILYVILNYVFRVSWFSIETIPFFLLSTLVFIFISSSLIIWSERKTIYREKFAFSITRSILTMAVAFFSPFIGGIKAINFLITGSEINVGIINQTPDKSVLIVFSIIFFIFCAILIIFYYRWDGGFSKFSSEENRFKLKSSLLRDTWNQIRAYKGAIELKLVNDNEYPQLRPLYIDEVKKIPWNEEIADLLCLSSTQYKIDKKNDWYKELGIFYSNYGKPNDTIIIIPLEDTPLRNEILELINSVKVKFNQCRNFIIAIKSDEGIKYSESIDELNIVWRYKSEILESLIDFSHYKTFLYNQFYNQKINSTTNKTLSDVYVDLDCFSNNDSPKTLCSTVVLQWLASSDNNQIALLGDYGQGKTVFCTKLCCDLLKDYPREFKRIPILIELRGRSPRTLSVIDILASWGSSFGIDPRALLKLHYEGKLLLIFEGFDEMDMVGDKEIRINHFWQLWKFSTPNSKIIFTGRPNFFFDKSEMKLALNIITPIEDIPHCKAYYINNFDQPRIGKALRNFNASTINRIRLLIEQQQTSDIPEIVSRPSTLIILAIMWEKGKILNDNININSAYIISSFMQASYERQQLKGESEFILNHKEREYFTLGIVLYMLKTTGYTNQLYKTDLNFVINLLYQFFPKDSFFYDVNENKSNRYIKDRLDDSLYAIESISTDVRTCGLLITDLLRNGYFKFAHKSYFEFNIALLYSAIILKHKEFHYFVINSLTEILKINIDDFVISKEVLKFASEILVNKLELSPQKAPQKTCIELYNVFYPFRFFKKNKFLVYSIYIVNIWGVILLATTLIILHFAVGLNMYYNIILLVLGSLYSISLMIFMSKRRWLNRWYESCLNLGISKNILKKNMPDPIRMRLHKSEKPNGSAILEYSKWVINKLYKFSKNYPWD